MERHGAAFVLAVGGGHEADSQTRSRASGPLPSANSAEQPADVGLRAADAPRE